MGESQSDSARELNRILLAVFDEPHIFRIDHYLGKGPVQNMVELLASRRPGAQEMDAYERVLGDAMAGDATLFAREDYVEEAWRIFDPVLRAGTPVYEYEPGTWGPGEAERRVSPPGGWHNPVVES